MFVSRRRFLQSSTALLSLASGMHLSRHAAGTSEVDREIGRGLIRLDRNENPYGPTAKVRAVISDCVDCANRYATDSYELLVQQITGLHGVSPENVLVGCGSSEILRATAAAFLRKDKAMLLAKPTFGMLDRYTRSVGATVVLVDLDRTLSYDFGGMLSAVDQRTALVYLCNPNNPTGSITSRNSLEDFLEKLPSHIMVLIDEAYHHYSGTSTSYSSFLDKPTRSPNVLVTRTFSKVYGLAGFRVGYGVGEKQTVSAIRPLLTQLNVGEMALRAALTALQDIDGVNEYARLNEDARQEFLNQALARMLRPLDSHTNFCFMDTHQPASAVVDHFRSHGILVAAGSTPMDSYIRVSLGTPGEMREFWRVWDTVPGNRMRM